MTFDLSKMSKHYATNKTNVSMCMPSFIHTYTIVAEKIEFFDKKSEFSHKLWPLMISDLHQYIHFWKAHITYYNCTKFQVSVINSV